MFTFSELIKAIRSEINFNQQDLAEKLGVSKIFIAQLETNKREPSKNFIKILSKELKVSSFSIMPFISNDEIEDFDNLSKIEKTIYSYGIKLQEQLVKKNSKYLLSNS